MNDACFAVDRPKPAGSFDRRVVDISGTKAKALCFANPTSGQTASTSRQTEPTRAAFAPADLLTRRSSQLHGYTPGLFEVAAIGGSSCFAGCARRASEPTCKPDVTWFVVGRVVVQDTATVTHLTKVVWRVIGVATPETVALCVVMHPA